jgi:DNA (cytosine-5)-methyltransferase 1
LAGCAPCQTFSIYNRKATPDDKRWRLLLQFARLVEEISPELVMTENVPGLQDQGVFKEFLGAFYDAKYHVHIEIVNCEEYGIPQRRRRLVLLASKLSPIRLLSPGEFGAKRATVRDAIADLPPLGAGEIAETDPLHQASILSDLNRKRIEASKPGGTWRDWQKTLVADCHKKKTGKAYPSAYGRMCWDEPAPTITTQFFGFSSGRFGHPDQNRAISLREGAILQSFPKDYEFVPPGQPIYKKSVERLIGNAVPPKLGEVIGLSILHHVDQWMKSRRLD